MKTCPTHLGNAAVLAASLAAFLGASTYVRAAGITLSGTSYTQNFDSISGGLPAGWSVNTGASSSSLGTAAAFTTSQQQWSSTTSQFANFASTSNGGTNLLGNETQTQQNAFTNRCPAVRQTGTLGDPGGAFEVQLANTLGFNNFQLSVDMNMLSVQTRSTVWTVDYGMGTSPTTFIPLGTYTDPGVFGTTTKSFSFGTALDNQSQPVWIRITALATSTGSGSRDTFGIDNFSLTYQTAPATPTITTQPASQTNNAGTTATFSVSATGSGLSYQWQKNGSNLGNGGKIAGATTSSLSVSSVLAANAGNYTVIVTNSSGSVTSSIASLTVIDPYISSQPTNQTAAPGATANFYVVAQGTTLLTYQWFKGGIALVDGANISGSTTTNLTISNVGAGDAGTYTVMVTNALSSTVTSQPALLALSDPSILSQPVGSTNNYGATATFTVSVAGTSPFTYQWLKNGAALGDGGNISGSQTGTLMLNSVAYIDAASYSVIITNGLGNAVTSSVAVLKVNDPVIVNQPVGFTNIAGSSANISVSALGTSLTYQWLKGNTAITNSATISGVNSSALSFTGLATSDSGSYSVIVSNSAGLSVTSSVASVSVIAPPTITSQPSSRTVQAGSSVTFVVGVSGTAPFAYQWQKGGNPIAGATTNSFSLSNVQTIDAAAYSVVVTNSAGTVTSSSAILTISSQRIQLSKTNLIVVRVGDGSQTIASTGNNIFLDQFTTNGTYLNTVSIPDSGSNSLLLGSSTAEGFLTLSADGKLLVLAGYNTNHNATVSLQSASSSAVPRSISTINGLSVYNLAVTTLSQFSANSFRAGASDGTNNFWGAGGVSGTYYFGLGFPTATVQSPKSNTRVIQIINGELYYSTSSSAGTPSTLGIQKFTGQPKTTSVPVNVIDTGASSSAYDFAMNPAGTIMYVTDDTSSAAGGIQRWDFSGTTWTKSYTLGSGVVNVGARGITVDFNGASPVIYATTAEGTTNRLVVITDTGAGSPAVTLATAGVNQLYRGIRFGPISESPSIAANPSDVAIYSGSSATFTVGVAGTAPFSYQWQKNGTAIDGATNSSFTIASASLSDIGQYSVVVTNDIGSVTSASAALHMAPTILGGPISVTSTYGSGPVSFDVGAIGEGSFSYQWKKNGANIAGATTSFFTISTPSASDEGNYSVAITNSYGFALSTNAALTINPVTLTVTANDASKAYGSANPSFSVNYSGFVYSDTPAALTGTLNITSTADASSVLGTYPIHASGLSSDNYNIVYVDGTLTITGGALTVSVDDTNRIYGAANPTFVTHLSGLHTGDNITATGVTTATTSSPVGTYNIGITLDDAGTGVLTNYTISTNLGTLTIDKAALSITANDVIVGTGTNTLSYLTNGVNTNVTIVGLQNGETGIGVFTTLQPAKPAAKTSTAANYVIAITNVIDTNSIFGNYTVTTNNGSLKVVGLLGFSLQPKDTKVVEGGKTTLMSLSKGTSTNEVPAYQWYFGTDTITMGAIPGATTANFVIDVTDPTNAGYYHVTITGLANSVTSTNAHLTVTYDTNAPAAAIIYPVALKGTNAGTVNAYGTASDNSRIDHVEYRLNGLPTDPWTQVGTQYRASANLIKWTNSIDLLVGTNVIEVRCWDYATNVSKIAKTTFFYDVNSTLVLVTNEAVSAPDGSPAASITSTVSVNPAGTPTNGADLRINRPYKVTAVIGHNELFTNWTASWQGQSSFVISTNPILTFMMQTNMTLTANFVHNPWMEAKGNYNGLATATNNDGSYDFEMSGFANFLVNSNQTFSGKLTLGGIGYSISGKMSIPGTALLTVNRSHFNKPNLTVALTTLFGALGSSGTNQIVGTVSDGTTTAQILSDHYVWNTNTLPCAYATNFTLLLPGNPDTSAGPGGNSYAFVKVKANGQITVASSAYAEGTPSVIPSGLPYPTMSLDGRWPFYQGLYLAKVAANNYTNNAVRYTNSLNLGSTFGWLQIHGLTNIDGTVNWVKKDLGGDTNILMVYAPAALTNYYYHGFTNVVSLLGEQYTYTLGTRILNFTNALLSVSGSGAGLPDNLEQQAMRLLTNNTLQLLGGITNGTNIVLKPKNPTNSVLGGLTLTPVGNISLLTGSFTNATMFPTPPSMIAIKGIMMQGQNAGYGFFLGTNGQSGAFSLMADPNNP